MHPYVDLLGKPFSTYGIAAFIGMLFAVLYSLIVHLATKDKKDFFNRFVFIVYGALFGGIFAAVFFQFTVIKGNIEALKYLFSDFAKFRSMFSAGLVFYGGMFGLFIGFMVYAQYFKENTLEWIRTAPAGFILFHAFGRIGCTIGGCCFGKVLHWHQELPNEAVGLFERGGEPLFAHGGVWNARIGAYCIPIQLYESLGLLGIFVIVVLYQTFMKNKSAYFRPMGLYFVLYSVLRFILEFWRGDLLRGIWGGFSFSQYISMFVFPLGLYCLFCPTEKNFLIKWYNGELRQKKSSAKESSGKETEETVVNSAQIK